MKKRLIAADALTAEIEGTDWYSVRYGNLVRGASSSAEALYKAYDIYRAIQNAKPVDAVPVVHARWDPFFEDYSKRIEGYRCSACGFEYYGGSIKVYHFCPNCGAKMDLKGGRRKWPK